MDITTRISIALSASLLALGALAQNKVALSISAGPIIGVHGPLGGGIANALARQVPGCAANVETTGGSVANLQLMKQKKWDLALPMPCRLRGS